MARYPKQSHLSQTDVRGLVGASCFVEIALALNGCWSSEELEGKIDGKGVYADGGNDSAGTYRKMLAGVVPDNEKVRHIEKALEKNTQLRYWRDHPYWFLLSSTEVSYASILAALNSVTGSIRQHVWDEYFLSSLDRNSARQDFDLSAVKSVSKYCNFDALIILTAWTVEAKAQRSLRNAYWGAKYSRGIFASVIVSSPHLVIRWKSLVNLYLEKIWSPPVVSESIPWFSVTKAEIYSEIETALALARKTNDKLPPLNLIN